MIRSTLRPLLTRLHHLLTRREQARIREQAVTIDELRSRLVDLRDERLRVLDACIAAEFALDAIGAPGAGTLAERIGAFERERREEYVDLLDESIAVTKALGLDPDGDYNLVATAKAVYAKAYPARPRKPKPTAGERWAKRKAQLDEDVAKSVWHWQALKSYILAAGEGKPISGRDLVAWCKANTNRSDADGFARELSDYARAGHLAITPGRVPRYSVPNG